MKPEQLEAIRRRSSATSGNWLADYLKLQSAQIVLTDDVPALIDEVERLQNKLAESNSFLSEAHDIMGDGYLSDTEIFESISLYLEGDA